MDELDSQCCSQSSCCGAQGRGAVAECQKPAMEHLDFPCVSLIAQFLGEPDCISPNDEENERNAMQLSALSWVCSRLAEWWHVWKNQEMDIHP